MQCPLHAQSTTNASGSSGPRLHTVSLKVSRFSSVFTVPVIIQHLGQPFVFTALIYSSGMGNFSDEDVVKCLNIPTSPLSPPLKIQAIDDRPIGEGTIT